MSGQTEDQILFVLDGIRPEIYTAADPGELDSSFACRMRQYFMTAACRRGYEVINLQPRFLETFHETGRKSEFPTDNHWNETGHRVVAAAIADSATFRRTFPALAH